MGIVNEVLATQFGAKNETSDLSEVERADHLVDASHLTHPSEGSEESEAVTIIHSSRLFRDCLHRFLCTSSMVFDYSSVEAWSRSGNGHQHSLILIGQSGSKDYDERELNLLLSRSNGARIVAIGGDVEDLNFILDLLAKGVRGYIPASLALDVSIGALQIVRAGGIFVPADSLLASRERPMAASTTGTGLEMFTKKQLSVIDGIRHGKANKTIAYELNMCESTVKVHVRNIMKRMLATNRTQVAFIANKILAEKPKGF